MAIILLLLYDYCWYFIPFATDLMYTHMQIYMNIYVYVNEPTHMHIKLLL